MTVKVKVYLKRGACRVYAKSSPCYTRNLCRVYFDLDWIFETGSHCSLDWSRTHCVSQTTLTPLQSSCFSLPSSGMTGLGHHAQLEHPQIFIPKGAPETKPLLPAWDNCVRLLCSLTLGVPAFSEGTGCVAASHPTLPPGTAPAFQSLFTPPPAAHRVQFLHILIQACALHPWTLPSQWG